jgi:3-oxoadipate enol-lactonase
MPAGWSEAMEFCDLGGFALAYQKIDPVAPVADVGEGATPVLLMLHDIGMDHRIWQPLMAHLPPNLMIICPDLRGHGQSGGPPAPWSMGALVRDVEHLLEHLALRDVVVIGLGLGGMLAQALAVKRLDLVRGLVLVGTPSKWATPAVWAREMAVVQAGGMDAVVEAWLARVCARRFAQSATAADLRATFCATPVASYLATMAAISGSDFYASTAMLTLPTLGIVGSEDGLVPPDLAQETAALIKGADFTVLRRVGHVPPLEAPIEFSAQISGFLRRIGHGGGQPHVCLPTDGPQTGQGPSACHERACCET